MERAKTPIILFSFGLSFTSSRFVFYSVLALSCRGRACPTNRVKRYGERRFGSVCRRSVSSHDDGAADRATGVASRKVHAPVHGEAASSTSVPARSAHNGCQFHNVKIAVSA